MMMKKFSVVAPAFLLLSMVPARAENPMCASIADAIVSVLKDVTQAVQAKDLVISGLQEREKYCENLRANVVRLPPIINKIEQAMDGKCITPRERDNLIANIIGVSAKARIMHAKDCEMPR